MKTQMTDEIFITKGEAHFVRPHVFYGGNSVRCGMCRYFREDPKSKDPYVKTGDCLSKAHVADWEQVGSGRTEDIHFCRWWFPIEKQEGEQEDLFDENAG